MRPPRTVLALVCLAVLVRPPAATQGQAECPGNVLTRAAAAVPHHTPPAFASLATRALAPSRLASNSTMPTIGARSGPGNIPALVFDRSKQQYLDGGALSMDASRGFTVLAVASFTLLPPTAQVVQDVLFSFASADGTTSFDFFTNRNTNILSVGFTEEAIENNCRMEFEWDIAINAWEVIYIQLEVLSTHVELSLNILRTGTNKMTCHTPLSYKTYDRLYIGGDVVKGQYMQGRIAGLYAVDRMMDATTLSKAMYGIRGGHDMLQACAQAACTPGTAGANGVSPCANCEPGKFQAWEGSIECTACMPGKYSASVGATDPCTNCTAGTYAAGAASACATCAAHTYSPARAGACAPGCLVGQFWHAARARCVQCAPAHYKDWNGTGVCTPCPPGTHTGTATGSSNASACVCPAGFEFGGGGGGCSPCAPGSARPASAARGARCAACAAGRYAARAGAAACKMCPAGFFAAAGGAAGCQQCPEGEAASANRTRCERLPAAGAPCAAPRVRVGVAALPAFVRVDAE